MKKILTAIIALTAACIPAAAVTLPDCLDSAQANYPAIRQYDLIDATAQIDLSDVNKAWLPHIGLYSQATVQNVVPSFPPTLAAMNPDMKGLGKLQYKVGADLSQTIWDGGASKSQRRIIQNRSTADRAALDVEIYAVRQRVQSIYFAILLLEAQIAQSQSTLTVYQSNLATLRSLVRNGAAMQADADLIEAQMLTLNQQITSAQSAVKGYRQMLSTFTGLDLNTETLQLPSAQLPAQLTPDRPELALLDARAALNSSQRALVTNSLMPKIGLFAQAYYGYPGIDYFKAMTNRNLSFNILAGVKISWNIDSFYNKHNSLRRINIADRQIQAERATFLFNNNLQSQSQLQEIDGLQSLLKDDQKIVTLRANVRNAAESQLRNGIIDATTLASKINDENQARLTAAYHQIQLIQAVYNLKNTLNR